MHILYVRMSDYAIYFSFIVFIFSNNTAVETSLSKSSSVTKVDRPGEVKLKRSNTTGSTGARPSKKTLLLRWCQKITEEYDVCVFIVCSIQHLAMLFCVTEC